jgi:hypothetical protein
MGDYVRDAKQEENKKREQRKNGESMRLAEVNCPQGAWELIWSVIKLCGH